MSDNSSVVVELNLAAEQFEASLATLTDSFRRASSGMGDDARDAGADVDRAFQALGVRSVEAVRYEIVSLQQAFSTLKTSGTTSAEDIARAEEALQRRVQSLNSEIGKVRTFSAMAGKGLSDAFATVGVRSAAQIQTEIHGIEVALQKVGQDARVSGADFDRAFKAGKARVAELTDELHGVSRATDGVSNTVQRMLAWSASLFAVDRASGFAKDVAQIADQYNNLSARLKLVVGDQADVNAAMGSLVDVAKRTSSGLEGTVTLFTRIAQGGKEMGISQQQALQLTESINQAVQLSGASAQASEAAITQLIQGLQSGVLRGEEFNSVMEQAPRLAQALADGLGVPIGKLRELAQAGRLTTQEVVRALQNQTKTIGDEFGKLPPTIGRAITNLNTEWMRFVGQLDKGSGASAAVAGGINALAAHLDDLAGVAERAGAVLVTAFAIQAAAAIRAYSVEVGIATAATNLLGTSVSKLPRLVSIAVAFTGLEAGWQIGTWMNEHSATARKLGVGMVHFAEGTANAIQLIWEALKAGFTKDTVEAAFGRFKTRAKELREITDQMYKDAEQAPGKTEKAAEQAGAAAEQAKGAATAASGAMGGLASETGKASAAAEDAVGAMRKLASAAGVSLPAAGGGVAEFARALVDASVKSEAVTREVGKSLPEAVSKLSGATLNEFRTAWLDAMSEAIEAEQRAALSTEKTADERAAALAKATELQRLLSQGTTDLAARAAQALGIDVPVAIGQMSKGFSEAHENFSILLRSIPELSAQGIEVGTALQQSFQKMIDAAKNQADIEAIERALRSLGESGRISGEQLADGLAKAERKSEELKRGVDLVADAYKQLGMKSPEELRKAAAEAEKSFQMISNSGVASAADIREAFKRYAEAAIAANGGVVSDAVRGQAAMRGLRIETDEAGRSIVKLDASPLGKVADGADHAAGSLRKAREESDGLNASLDRKPQPQRQGGGLSGSGPQPDGLTLEQMQNAGWSQREIEDYQLNRGPNQTPGMVNRNVVTEEISHEQVARNAGLRGDAVKRFAEIYPDILNDAMADFRAKGSNTSIGTPTGYRDDFANAMNSAIREAASRAQRAPRIEEKSSSAPAKTVRVELMLPGGGSAAINAADEGSADAFIKALEMARRSSI